MHIWLICQKWSLFGRLRVSSMVTMKEHLLPKTSLDWDDWVRLQFTWEGSVKRSLAWAVWLWEKVMFMLRIVGTMFDSLKTGCEPSRHSLIPSTMTLSSPDGLDVYSPALSTSLLLYSASAFYFLCIVLWLNLWVPSFLNKLSVSRPSICLSGCQLQFWSQLSFISHSCPLIVVWTGLQWFSFSTHPNALFIFQSNILAATFSHHLFCLQSKLFYSRQTWTAWLQLC